MSQRPNEIQTVPVSTRASRGGDTLFEFSSKRIAPATPRYDLCDIKLSRINARFRPASRTAATSITAASYP